MPAAWVSAGAAAFGALSSSGGGGGGGQQMYTPSGLNMADGNWQGAAQQNWGIASQNQQLTSPAFAQSYADERGIGYGGYQAAADRAGYAFGNTGDRAMQQMQGYGQMADRAAGQQQQMYDAGGRVLQTAFDPQEALYGRTAQRVRDQVRAGQAARGLGNSEVGMMEEAGAMGNFNIDWQNAQLARQATGIQAGAQASHAGVQQGQMYGADQSAALAAGAAGAGYYGQSGQVPLTAREYVAGAPGRAANEYLDGMGGVSQGWGSIQSAAIPYMNYGQGALQQNWKQNYQSNRDMAAGLGQIGQAVAPKVAGWFGGEQQNPTWSQNWGAAMGSSGVNGADQIYG